MFSFLDKPTTFSVNYSGKTTYGSCDKHIRGLYPETNCGYEMVIEITVAGGFFLLDITQMWKENVYYEAFLRELEANGLHPLKFFGVEFSVAVTVHARSDRAMPEKESDVAGCVAKVLVFIIFFARKIFHFLPEKLFNK